jgi:hypothetical protein
MGSYPLFCCANWQALPADLDELAAELVSLTVVTDPFGDWDLELLQRCFPDKLAPFKTHYAVNLREASLQSISQHHRENLMLTRKSIAVDVCENPLDGLDVWVDLYAHLIQRHQITGLRAFSRQAFELQLSAPGMVAFRAFRGGEVVGMHLVYVRGRYAYNHLSAYSPIGYRHGASYALYWFTIDYLKAHADWFDLGAGAGLDADAKDGLSWFKKGWANATRTVHLGGRVFDHAAYRQLMDRTGTAGAAYFPAYRSGEFA